MANTGQLWPKTTAEVVSADTLIVRGPTESTLQLDSTTPLTRRIRFTTNNQTRWQFFCNNTSETGSNSGSDFNLGRYDDAGNFLATALVIARSSGTLTLNNRINTAVGTTAQASLRIPHGAAPTSPANGDVWSTTAGVYVQINGATVGPIVDSGMAGFPVTPSGLWNVFWSYGSTGTITYAANQLRLVRVRLKQACSEMAIEVTTGAVGFNCQIAVYADGATGPGALSVASASIDCSTNGVKNVACVVANPGYYWVGAQNITSVATGVVRSVGTTNPYSLGYDIPAAGGIPGSCWQYNSAGTAPPTNVGALNSRNSTAPALYFKAT